MNRLKSVGMNLKRELKAYQRMLRHRRTPRTAKFLLALAVGYALLPFDLIPDFIPLIGQIDDMIIVPALIFMAVKMIPKEVVEECRMTAEKEGG
ncbi:MAG: DUF1232 domain-containing protein [Candidatus Manganitrophus sp. SB1]|nr:DUF1232 domain-containing protein [Candidatus Manganitrophus morganii]